MSLYPSFSFFKLPIVFLATNSFTPIFKKRNTIDT